MDQLKSNPFILLIFFSEQRTYSTYYPSHPSLRLESDSPAELRLSWSSIVNETTNAVLYAVIVKQSQDEWKVIKWVRGFTSLHTPSAPTCAMFTLCNFFFIGVNKYLHLTPLGLAKKSTEICIELLQRRRVLVELCIKKYRILQIL